MNDRLGAKHTVSSSRLGVCLAMVLMVYSATKAAEQLAPNPNPAGETIVIEDSRYVWNFEYFFNFGTIDNRYFIENNYFIENSGIIRNSGILDNHYVFDNLGTVDNQGTIENDDYIDNRGTITNRGTIENDDFIDNDGTIDNQGHILNWGTIDNLDTLDNSGTIDNAQTLWNSGTITNSGLIDNPGTLDNRHTIENSGTINNRGTFESSSGFTNQGIFKGTGTFVGTLDTGTGTVAPGNSVGTMFVDGDYLLDGTGTLEIEIGGFGLGESDLLDVTGTAYLTGGTIDLLFLDGYDISADIGYGESLSVKFLEADLGIDIFASTVAYDFLGTPSGFVYDVYLEGSGLWFSATNTGPGPDPVTIPAPGAMLLGGIGAVLVGCRERRRRR